MAESPRGNPYFAIHVVDEQTERGIPCVELETTSGARYYTDSAGTVAFYEPGLMNRKVWFTVSSHGYEFPADGFGLRGAALLTRPGEDATLRMKRLNIAVRLYRITGEGIYRDTVLLGRRPPVDVPLLNAEVTGQDSVLNAIYKGKLYWFYGDTSRISHPLGNFATTGAVTPLPKDLNPSQGFILHYLTAPGGFVRPMAPMDGEGVVWLSGLVDRSSGGAEQMLAWFQRRKGLGALLENGFVIFDDKLQRFRKLKSVPLDPVLTPAGCPFLVKSADGRQYFYFTSPYPNVRVPVDSYTDLTAYEGYTCLKQGTRFRSAQEAEVDRDEKGAVRWGWKLDTPPLSPQQQEQLIQRGKLRADESPFRLHDRKSGAVVLLNSSSCCWNEYRKRYILIGCEVQGATVLGEIWYAEAPSPEGPWSAAVKIITHANKKGDAQDFYNPVQHAFFDSDRGRIIYLEGTYVNTFSGNPHPTPYYNYNQIMYRLDLSDARLHRKHPA